MQNTTTNISVDDTEGTLTAGVQQTNSSFPQELLTRQQWLIWRFVQKPGQKKPSKMPYYASGAIRTGVQGSEDDRNSLVDYDTAVAAVAEHSGDGLGFAFLPNDGLIGIDIDGALNDDVPTERRERAQRIIEACGSYTEYSPSMNGIHIIVTGQTETFKSNELGIEVFCGRQFFTMSGNPYPGTQHDIANLSDSTLEKLRRTVKNLAAQPASKPHQQPASSDRTKLESALVFIQADCGYEDWIRVGMAIHAELGESGLAIWDWWSARGSKYPGPHEVESHFRSFKPGSVTGGSLYRMAMDAGWQPPKQVQLQVQAPVRRLERIDLETGEVLVDSERPLAANDNTAVDFMSPLPDCNDRMKPLATLENLAEVCRRLGVVVRYNVISKEEELLIPNAAFSIDNKMNASLAWLKSWCARFRMATDSMSDYVTALADGNLFNPVTQWVESREWDGVSRLPALYATITSTDEPLKETLIKRWMLSAIAAAVEPDGVSAHGVLVLQGSQYVGKTKWFKSLVPASLGVLQDGMLLNPTDRDSVKKAVSFWLVELGELDATFRKADIAALKSFLTLKNDIFRRAYARKESTYARRTVFFGSVNPKQFLHDPTGNRRYWTIEATHIDHSHTLDMQQVWAEVYAMYKGGEGYFLLDDEMDKLNGHNEEFTVSDPITERIQSKMDWSCSKTGWQWRSATDVLISIGMDRPNQSDVTKAATFIRRLNGGEAKRGPTGRLLFVPPVFSYQP